MEQSKSPVSQKSVDIRRVFHDKNPRLASLIPGFLYNYLEKVIHQDQINDFLHRHGHEYGIDFARAIIDELHITLDVRGEENLPADKRCIFAYKHPLGGFDGVILLEILSRHYKECHTLSNDILMNIVNLRPVFLPINKHGRQGQETAEILHKAYLSDTQIVTFPAGLVSRRIKGQIADLEWKKNFISKAVQYQRDVVPVHCTGRNSDFFYRLANLRKRLKIKSNIEMLYLVDETYKHEHEHIVVTFGKPIPYTTFDRTKT